MKLFLLFFMWSNFVQVGYIPRGTPSAGAGKMLVADTDCDGLLEIIFVQREAINYEVLWFYEQTIDNPFNFSVSESVIIHNDTLGLWLWETGDFDLDGFHDLVFDFGRAPPPPTVGISIYESPDSFSYPTNEVWRDTVGSALASPIGTYDVDNDGFPEIIKTGGDLTFQGYEDFVVYESIGDNTYLKIFSEVTQASPTSTIGFGDFDNDRFNEFVLGEIDGLYSVYENIGDNNYQARVLNQQLPSANCFDVFSVPDADSDGKMEFVVRGYTFPDRNHRVFIFEATADNTYQIVKLFVFSSIIQGGAGAYSASGSVDGDSIPEMVLLTYPWIRIIKASSNNSFYVWDSIPVNNTGSIAIYDIDNNGLKEIIYSGNDETIIYEKGIDMEWVFPAQFDTFYAGDTLNLKWRVYDSIALDSLYVYFQKTTPSPRTLIYQGVYTDTTCDFFVPDTSGMFRFYLVVKGQGRKDSLPSTLFRIMELGVKENAEFGIKEELKIFPTIFSKELKIIFNLQTSKFINLNLYNSSGKLIQNIFTGKIQGQKTMIFAPQNRLAPGIYFIIAKWQNKSSKKKVIYLRK